MSSLIREGRNSFLILISSILIGTLAMIAVYSLPTEKMYRHIQGITEMYHSVETQPKWGTGWHTALDNFTDAVMIMTAVHPSSGSVVVDAMHNARWNHYQNPSDNPVSYLIKKTQDNNQSDMAPPINYERYWHGYLTILKPLLSITDVQNIRIINSYLQFFLLLIVMIGIYNQLGSPYVFAFSLAVLTINPVTTALSFQNSTIYYIILLSVLALLKWNDRLRQHNCFPYFFLLIGIATAYFDFWTYPVATLGTPLIFLYLLNRPSFRSAAAWLGHMLHNAVSWGIGYIGMWSGKFVMCTALTDTNIFSDTYNYISQYQMALAVSPTVTATPLNAIKSNLSAFWNDPLRTIFVLSLLYVILLIVRKRKFIIDKISLTVFLSIGILPFLWYAIIPKHSWIHIFFTYRELSVMTLALACLAISCVSEQPVSKNDR